VGGDALRMAALARVMPRAADAAWSVVVDRVLGVIALLLLLVAGLAVADVSALPRMSVRAPAVTPPAAAAVLGVAALVAVLVARFGTRVWRRARAAGARLAALLRRPPDAWARWIALALLVQLAYVATWVAIAAVVRLPVPVTYFLVAVPLVSLAAMVPVTIAGLGVREGAWAALLAPLGVPAGDAVAFSLLYFAGFALTGAIGGAWFAWRGTMPAALGPEAPGTAPPLRAEPSTNA
jgi:hypothetical protein